MGEKRNHGFISACGKVTRLLAVLAIVSRSVSSYRSISNSHPPRPNVIGGTMPGMIDESIEYPGIIIIGPDDTLYPAPMRAMKVLGNIVDGVAAVTLEQEFETSTWNFENVTSHYQLPIDESAAVIEFSAEVGDRVIKAVVKEKSVAREEFNEAVDSGKNAYLAEQTRPDIFKISVGNLPTNQVVKVHLTYVTTLESMGGNVVKFVFPTAIAPRYEPHPMNNTEDMIEELPDLMKEGVQIEIKATAASSFVNITSETHELDVSGELVGERTVKVLSDVLNRDVVIYFQTKREHVPKLYIEKSSKESSTAMMLSIVPGVESEIKYNSEFIFIVDRSGSMYGQKIAQTRKALKRVLLALPEGSLFNIIGFGSKFSALFENSMSQSDIASMSVADNYITLMDADFGGTEILEPLKYALSAENVPGFDRQVIVMTDGQVSNTADIIKFVREFRAKARVFSLGIGNHVSRLLVRGIARSGRGTAEFVDGDSDQAVFDAVERQMEVALTPTLDDLIISWRGSASESIQQAPFVAPPLLANKRFLLYFLVDSETLPEDVVMSALNYGSGLSIKYIVKVADAVFLPASPLPGIIHKMAARAMIRDLEEGGSSLSLRGEDKEESEVANRIKEEIVRLGTKYQIASSQTSFIAVDNLKWFKIPDFLQNIQVTAQSSSVVTAQSSSVFQPQMSIAYSTKAAKRRPLKMASSYTNRKYSRNFMSNNMKNLPTPPLRLAAAVHVPSTAAPIAVPSFAPSMMPSEAGPTESAGRKLSLRFGRDDWEEHDTVDRMLDEKGNYQRGKVLTSTACTLGVYIIPLIISQAAVLLAIF